MRQISTYTVAIVAVVSMIQMMLKSMLIIFVRHSMAPITYHLAMNKAGTKTVVTWVIKCTKVSIVLHLERRLTELIAQVLNVEFGPLCLIT